MGEADPGAGARTTVAELYERHRAAVYAVALRYGAGDVAFAEDVLQDVFVRLLPVVESLENIDDLGGWLYRVTTNCCLTRLRRDQFRRGVHALLTANGAWTSLLGGGSREGRGAGDTPVAELVVERRRAAEEAFRALAVLPPKERVVFCAYHLDERSQPEIAALLGCSKSYVCKLLARAERRLADTAATQLTRVVA